MTKISFNETVDIHYPITVMQRQFEQVEQLNQDLFREVEGLETRFKDSEHNAVRSNRITTDGGFQTSLSTNLFESNLSCFNQLKSELLLPAIKDYLASVFAEAAQGVTPHLVGWANMLSKGNWQRPHLHPTQKNLISGVYYVRIPEFVDESDGHIEFINPMPISINHGYSNTRRLKPKSGKLILFPPYYMHFVHPIKSEEKRAVIAFDVLSESPGMKLVF